MTQSPSHTFDYVRPTDWAEANRLLRQPGAVAKMGGCEVLMRFRRGKLAANVVVGLHGLQGIGEIDVGAQGTRIGAAVTLAELQAHRGFADAYPVIADVIGRLASPAIRAAGTLAGNVAQGWSVGDLVPLLQVCDATLEIRNGTNTAFMPVVDYAKSPGTRALKPGDIIAAVHLPALPPDSRLVYERFSFKNAFDLPLVAVALRVSKGDNRLAVVGGGPMPSRCEAAERALNEGKGADAAVKALTEWAKPASDFHASADYRRHVLGVTLRRALEKHPAI